MRKNIKIIFLGISVYLISAVIVFFVLSKTIFSQTKSKIITSPSGTTKQGLSENLIFNDNLPKTEKCPLNGVLYSKSQRDWWEKHRVLGVMIENHQEARPQSGISSADIVYEAVAEGGITRFLAIFYCQDAGIIGPVRSARTYFLDFISEYAKNPLYAHVGGANTPGPADALSQIEQYGWNSYNDLNQFSIGFPTFWRDYERLGHEAATEHTMYSTTSKLWDLAAKRGLANVDENGQSWDALFVPYKFKNDLEFDKRPPAQSVSFDFWSGYSDYSVKWDYDKNNNIYLRSVGGQKHIDRDNNKQLAAKNLVILFMKESRANDGYDNNLHLIYQDKGSGQATVFLDGKKINATWQKESRTARTILKDEEGKEINFNPGVIWFEILPLGDKIEVK